MAYILEIIERSIDTKTNAKPFQNQFKTYSRIVTKLVASNTLANYRTKEEDVWI